MASLTIRLLGSPEVTVGGQPLSFRTRKVLALLVYLVVEGGMHSREALMALLWPETPDDKAAITLRVTLSRLRRALQPAGAVLVTSGGQVGVNFTHAPDLDLAWLAAAVLPDTSPDDLAPILEIDRGEFLAGFSLPDAPQFDDWAAFQREACQRQVEAVYDRLTQVQLANQDSGLAVGTAARWVARAPLSEAAYRRLMAAQALSGDRSAALKTYADCQAMLRAEFGIEAAQETAILAENIGRDRLPGLSGSQEMSPGSASVSGPAPGSPEPLLPFEGRADEHSQLVSAFRQASLGDAQAVAMIGAAGVGKTRLVNAFREWVLLDFPRVEFWEGRAFEIGGRLPYQPVIDALRQRLERENAPEDLLDDVWLSELSQLMPELRARYPDLPLPMTGDAGLVRSRLFSAVAALGSALAARQPAVFVLDDMHWADADTRDLIHFLARRWVESKTPVLLLLTVRQESYAGDARLREWLAQLGRDIPLKSLLLDRLGGTAVRQLVTRLAAPGADVETTSEFGAWLWSETDGLPFFIEALLQMLVAEGVLAVMPLEDRPRYDFAPVLAQVRSGGQLQVPPGVREAIRSRLDRLSEAETDLLLAGSVLGRECSFDTLCQITNLSESEALQAVEALLNGNLFVESRTARRPYTLAHDYLREVVYSESHAVRRRIFHRRALIALETERAPAAECAYHAAASLLDEPAFRYSLAAGDEALQSNALIESLGHYDRAREIAGRIGLEGEGLAPLAVKQLYQQRGRALELTLQFEAAQANYQELEHLAAEREDSRLKLAAIIAQCILYATYTPAFDPQKGHEFGQAALDLAAKLGDQEAEARALWCLMLVEFHTAGENQKVLAYGEKALQMARALGLKELEGYVLGNLSWAYSLQMQIDESLRMNDLALEIWRSLRNLPMIADAISIKMGSLYFAGRYEELLASADEAARLGQEIGNGLHHYMALLFLGIGHGQQGRLGQALTYFEQAGQIYQESGDERLAWGHLFYEIPVYLSAGAVEQAELLADRIFTGYDWKKPIFLEYFIATFALAKIAAGRLQEGEAVLRQALPAPDQEPAISISLVPAMTAEVHLQLALGNLPGVLDRAAYAIQQLNRTGGRLYLAELFWLQGKAWLALEKSEQAKQSFLQAKAVAEATGERVILWQILAALGELGRIEGDETEAEEYRCQAREIIDYIAENTGSEALKETFLAQPAAARAMTGCW